MAFVQSRCWVNVRALHFKRNKVRHIHGTLHTSGIDAGSHGGQMVQTGAPLISQRQQPPPITPHHRTMACVPAPLTRPAQINRRLSRSPAHFGAAAPRASTSTQKAQKQTANEMSPTISTEADQPLPARSTVAQRKQANELRKVRERETR